MCFVIFVFEMLMQFTMRGSKEEIRKFYFDGKKLSVSALVNIAFVDLRDIKE